MAEAKARFAELVAGTSERRAIIQRRGKDVAVVIGIEELARIERANDGATAGARLLARLDRIKQRHGGADLAIEPLRFPARDPFARRKKKRA